MTAPQLIWTSPETQLSLHDFCEQQAEKFTKEYSFVPLFFTDKCILHFIDACTGDGELKEELTDDERDVAKSVCQLLARSAEIEASKHLPEPEPELSAEEIQMIEECSQEAPGLLPEPEQTIEPLEESGGQEGAVEAQEPVLLPGGSSDDLDKPRPLQDAYNASIAAQQAGKEVVRAKLKQPNSQELGIVEAARSATKGSYLELKELFDFGTDLEGIRAKPGVPVAPADWAKALGFSAQWVRSGSWLMADCITHLEALGFENAVAQIGAEFKLAASTVYNARRLSQRIPMDSPARQVLDITTCGEIALPRYDKDEAKQAEIVAELLQEAVEGQWDAATARSHSKAKRGHNEEINGETRQSYKVKYEEAKGVLQKLLDHYIVCRDGEVSQQYIDHEAEVIAARRILNIIVQP